MRIEEIASYAKYRRDEIWQCFENFRNFENLFIFKFDNFKILLKVWKFRKLSNFHNWNFFSNLQIYKIY